jgi:hypothetical protein
MFCFAINNLHQPVMHMFRRSLKDLTLSNLLPLAFSTSVISCQDFTPELDLGARLGDIGWLL